MNSVIIILIFLIFVNLKDIVYLQHLKKMRRKLTIIFKKIILNSC